MRWQPQSTYGMSLQQTGALANLQQTSGKSFASFGSLQLTFVEFPLAQLTSPDSSTPTRIYHYAFLAYTLVTMPGHY